MRAAAHVYGTAFQDQRPNSHALLLHDPKERTTLTHTVKQPALF